MAKECIIGKSYLWIYEVHAIGVIAWAYMSNNGSPLKTSWDIVKNELIQNDNVEKVVVVNDKIANVYIKPNQIDSISKLSQYKGLNKSTHEPQFYFRIGSLEKFQNDFEKAQNQETESIPLEFKEETSIWNGLSGLLPIALII